jgi:lipid-binding SYLF domain-containing protein
MKNTFITALGMSLALASGIAAAKFNADDAAEHDKEAQVALGEFREKMPGLDDIIARSVGYVVIPTVGKGGIGIGGARGKGVLYEGGEVTGEVTLSQLSIGFQWGGQAYSEFIFFEDDVTLAEFKRGNYELNAQASAVAVTAGASADAEFNGGMLIYTQAKGGLMYEAAVGGQKFKVELK